MPIYATPQGTHFFDVPNDVTLPPGDFAIANLRRKKLEVDEASLAPYAIDEDTAKKRAMAEAQVFKERAEAVTAQLGTVRDTLKAAAAEIVEGLKPGKMPEGPSFDATGLTAALMQKLAPLKEALGAALDEDKANTPEGRAELAAIAQKVKDAGGPDWTADPGAVAGRLRTTLNNPKLVEGLASLRSDLIKGQKKDKE